MSRHDPMQGQNNNNNNSHENNSQDFQIPTNFSQQNDNNYFTLSRSSFSSATPAVTAPTLPSVQSAFVLGPPPSRHGPIRRNRRKLRESGKSDTIPPPYSWATNQRAIIHSLNTLNSKQIFTITGDVQCKRCERKYEIEFDLREKFAQVGAFIALHKVAMHDRAPDIWMNPALPTCKFCEQENSVKPIIAPKKKEINWLFLLLGQFLGCCTLEQLKYFCKHNKNHRTGAKDRVLYLTYLTLCRQLDSTGPFDR
ncbi:uncharacterized protein LOC107819346 [Nicotiana tabacum]|uniref:Uncharacterized protein LOC107819346 n=1 Tax=Nicotiana tabacum TaxID=4097 RepID=A0A1S4CIE2_TOBAC|nr:PREDICTED: uncharacterized protein LOC107819346 [Nicotiana tabacum]